MSHQSFPKANGSITDGYVLTYSSTDGYWEPKPLTATTLQFVQPHDTSLGPLALYQFNGNLNDSSGNGRTLTLDAGTARYADISPHLKGFAFDGSTRLRSTDSVFSIIGDITIEMLCYVQTTGSDRIVISYMDSGESLATNYLYSIFQVNSGLYFQYFAENAGGTNIQYDNTSGSYPVGEIFHLAMVRQSQVITFYVNGKILGATSGTQATPATTAGTQKFYVGGNVSDNGFIGIISSLKVFNSALTATQIETEFELTLGNMYNKGILNSTTTLLSGNTVTQQSLTGQQDGYVLTWTNPAWSALPSSAASTAIAWATTKTGNFTATFSDKYIPVDTTSGSVTITLPASPVDGEFHLVTDVKGTAATNSIIVSGGGHNIIGASTYIMIGNYNTLQLAYHVGQGIWVII